MAQEEQNLTGGNTAESVVRLGATVSKPVTTSTAIVHSFLGHLRSVGFDGCPEALGVDEQERQIVEFIPGPLWHGGPPHPQTDFRRVGTLVRAFHDAAASFEAPVWARWDNRAKPEGKEIICHGDLAPWNLVCSPDQWAFIDWDNAVPATRLWDSAWTAISFPPFEPGCDLPIAALSMHAILDGYGLGPSSCGVLIELMVMRARTEYDLIVQGAKSNQQPWV